jgi:hypothetical protein
MLLLLKIDRLEPKILELKKVEKERGYVKKKDGLRNNNFFVFP